MTTAESSTLAAKGTAMTLSRSQAVHRRQALRRQRRRHLRHHRPVDRRSRSARPPTPPQTDVDRAIAAARRAFDETDWSTNRQKRFDLVKKYRELFEKNRDRLGELAMHEAGAAQGAVNRAHVDMALDGWDDYLRIFDRVTWEKDYGVREAFGSMHSAPRSMSRSASSPPITPWNVPLYVNIGKVVAALLAGCTVILKPAPNTPGMGAIFGELAAEAGFPAGVMQVVFGEDPAMAGEMLVADPRVDNISFTGSTAVGKRIMEAGAKTLKRIFLELGGKSAKIVLEDAPDFAMECMMTMLVFHAGQGCAVQSRLLVPRSRYEEARAILTQAYAGLGDNWGEIDNPAAHHGSGRLQAADGPGDELHRARQAGRRDDALPAARPGPTRAAAISSSRPASSTSPTTCASPRRKSSGRCWW